MPISNCYNAGYVYLMYANGIYRMNKCSCHYFMPHAVMLPHWFTTAHDTVVKFGYLVKVVRYYWSLYTHAIQNCVIVLNDLCMKLHQFHDATWIDTSTLLMRTGYILYLSPMSISAPAFTIHPSRRHKTSLCHSISLTLLWRCTNSAHRKDILIVRLIPSESRYSETSIGFW